MCNRLKAVQTWIEDDQRFFMLDDGSIWAYDWAECKYVMDRQPIPACEIKQDGLQQPTSSDHPS